MTIIPRAFRRCPFCKKSGCDSFAPKYGIYRHAEGETGYHSKCLKEVLENPEVFGHAPVDLALDLEQRTVCENEYNANKLQRHKERIAEVQQERGK